ncbi:MAG TPA: hypothetical protein H9667_10435 [Firmicutes bacterium]|nr:hypothetical protein [Bacillales bacterium]HJA41902.1 hypothetical protein [Bacillota bacterium]
MSQSKKQLVAPLIEQLLETVLQESNLRRTFSDSSRNSEQEISTQFSRMIEKMQAKQNF